MVTSQSSRESEANDREVRDVLVETAQTQLAAVTAATRFWAGWAEMADRYAQVMTDELARIDAEGDAGDLVGRLSDLTREYLRDLSELPTASVKQFNSELEKVGKTNKRKRTGQSKRSGQGKRTRAARAKD